MSFIWAVSSASFQYFFCKLKDPNEYIVSQIRQRKILGAPISPITMRNLLDAIPPATLIVEMDIQVIIGIILRQ